MHWQRETLEKQIDSMQKLDKQGTETFEKRGALVQQSVQLKKQLETLVPSPKVALISGYTPEEVASLIGDDGSSYRIFWKPFDIPIFLQMIRNVLDAPQREIASYARP